VLEEFRGSGTNDLPQFVRGGGGVEASKQTEFGEGIFFIPTKFRAHALTARPKGVFAEVDAQFKGSLATGAYKEDML
jgi:hypothetical protein